jgi:hypothetical protein
MPVREVIGRFKYVEEASVDTAFEETMAQLQGEVADLISKGAENDD